MIEIKTFYFNDLRVCCYIVSDTTSECVVIDPGCSSESELKRVEKYFADNSLTPVKILLTHGHFDHVMGLADVAEKWNLKTYMHEGDIPQIERAKQYCAMFGIDINDPDKVEREYIKDGDIITFGNSELRVIATPGHTKGGVCYYNAEKGVLFSGDTLFASSIGRTDHPGGDYDELIGSITTKLTPLPPQSVVLPGHGPSTTIGDEVRHNPFLQSY